MKRLVNQTIGGLVIPVVLSAAFCFFTGINFVFFWKTVFRVFSESIHKLISLITPENIAHMQKWFRDMIFCN